LFFDELFNVVAPRRGKKQKGLRVTLKRQLSVIIVVVLRKHRQLFTAPLPVSHGGSTKTTKEWDEC
jgi:hypothetical protein